MALAAGVAVLGGLYWAYDSVFASRYVSTDNAYVGADVAQVTPLVAGPVVEVTVQDTHTVKRGDVLVRLDDTDARLALAEAEAALQAAERRVRGIVATDSGLASQVAARGAERAQAAARLASRRADLDKARIDLERREALAASGSVSGEELTIARNAFNIASANLRSAEAEQALAAANQSASANLRSAEAEQALAAANQSAAASQQRANSALIENSTIETNPEVAAARARRDRAKVDLERTVIRAAVDGVITRRQVQIGQRVQPGAVLMVIVPTQQAYVDANFQEVQLAKVRPGQAVTLHSDLYGSDVEYHGKVVGFSGGTGAAFSVVPAQNATGNWIKVVQRLPVRIALDPRELARHPLRVGLSMNVTVDVSE
ncbi:MAG: EmrA/EmrK family multidrug efflux transporter periplasmic adaptor subunit [Sphingomonas sp. 32-66-10]|nr:MAG: EmrA/EmrK family multidrug efflux transporter periplasmic adaptor subunit [Sphingomonas sp. 32-66-10]